MAKPPQPLKLPLPKRPSHPGGQATSTGSIHRSGEEKPLATLPMRSEPTTGPLNGPALSGVSVGMTIPGPPKTFLSARVDAWCSFPHPASAAAAAEAMKVAYDVCQEFLAEKAAEAEEAMRNMSG